MHGSYSFTGEIVSSIISEEQLFPKNYLNK